MASMHNELIGPYEAMDVHSAIVDEHYRVFVSHLGDRPGTTLVMTDANVAFAAALKVIQSLHMVALVPDITVVGIGYGGSVGPHDTFVQRTRDLTPTDMAMFPGGGGGDAFLSVIVDEVLPLLEGEWPGSTDELAYFGHSFGGLFGAHALFSGRSPFTRYILGSPSLWWGPTAIAATERQWARDHADLTASVYSAIGEWETDDGRRREGANLPDDHPMKPPAIFLDMVADLEAFAAALTGRGYPSLEWHHEVIPHEVHMTANIAILSRGLRHFFADRDPARYAWTSPT